MICCTRSWVYPAGDGDGVVEGIRDELRDFGVSCDGGKGAGGLFSFFEAFLELSSVSFLGIG